ncbi:hypothetical protein BDF14DRAFT_1785323 [Spinellus fusiger]|nr:hypothetical protein BDF14DRAFT_1785323 [Spinellus fusiger]
MSHSDQQQQQHNYQGGYQQSPNSYGAPPPGGQQNYGAPPPSGQQNYGSYGQHQSGQGPQGQARPPGPPGQQQGPPPGADLQLWGWFKAVDTDNSGVLTVNELQHALINGDWSPFNIETVRTMVNMFDTDNTGTINFHEFTGLWKYIEEWKKCFQAFDTDRSGSIDRGEMANALRAFGYNVSDKFITVLIQKFDRFGKCVIDESLGTKSMTGRGNVTFDNFVQACVTVKTLTDSFRTFDTDSDGWIQINYEQFLDLVVRQQA